MMNHERIAEYDDLVAWRTEDGGLLVEYGADPLRIVAGDRLEFSWGGPGAAAIGSTPFYLVHCGRGVRTMFYNVTLLDERDPDYRDVLHGLRGFLAAIRKANPGIEIVEE